MKISSVQKIGVVRQKKIPLEFKDRKCTWLLTAIRYGFKLQWAALRVLLGLHTVPLTGIKIGARKTKNTFLLICRKSGNHGIWMGGSSLRQLTRSPLEYKMKDETRKIPFELDFTGGLWIAGQWSTWICRSSKGQLWWCGTLWNPEWRGKKKNTLGSAAPDGRHLWEILCCVGERFSHNADAFLLFNCNEV